MGVTVWSSSDARHARTKRLANGAWVAIAVVAPSGEDKTLKFKRRGGDGTWPADNQAVTVKTLSKSEPFFIEQHPRTGVLLFGNGHDIFLQAKTTAPKQQSDFTELEVLP